MKPDRAKLDASMPSILSASKNNAVIRQLCFRPGYSKRTFVEKLSLTSEHGVEGCRWSHMPWLKKEDGSGDPSIQVSILQKRVLDLVYEPGGDTIHPGDTFIVDMDLSHENLPVGAILQSGDVQLRVGGHWNNACVKWKVRYGVAALNWVREDKNIKYRLRGVLCEIIKDGTIANGDLLTKL